MKLEPSHRSDYRRKRGIAMTVGDQIEWGVYPFISFATCHSSSVPQYVALVRAYAVSNSNGWGNSNFQTFL